MTDNRSTSMPRHGQHWEACMDERRWHLFIGTSLFCLLGGVASILFVRACCQLRIASIRRKQTAVLIRQLAKAAAASSGNGGGGSPSHHHQLPSSFPLLDPHQGVDSEANSIISFNLKQHRSCWARLEFLLKRLRTYALRLISYHWFTGRLFIMLSFAFSMCSFGIYAYEATMWPQGVEKCGHKGRRFRMVDFVMNCFFLFHFLLRLTAARDVLVFWIDCYSLIDYFTVPPTLIGFFLGRSWLGFRFLRIFRLTNLSEVLHNLGLVTSSSRLRMCHLLTLFASIWLAGAGAFHLLENTGNPFGQDAYTVTKPRTYFDAFYFTIITMATIGYGDITPETYLGRVFVSFFTLFALATFGGAIPEIYELIFMVRKYSGVYVKPEGKAHVVVCGDITTESVENFLFDFLHEDRQRSDVEVVFINPSTPDSRLQSLLQLHFTRVKYFQGTVMNQVDLDRVHLSEADACLILATPTASCPNEKDAANIMRVIAVKNYAAHIRVIVQLLQTENKAHLFNSPYWNWDAGDEIICFSELKLGFLAQSCIAPGFSTLLTNLFSTCSAKSEKSRTESCKALFASCCRVNNCNGCTSCCMSPCRSSQNCSGSEHKRPSKDHLLQPVCRSKAVRSLEHSSPAITTTNMSDAVDDRRMLFHWASSLPSFLRDLFIVRQNGSDDKLTTTAVRPTSTTMSRAISIASLRPNNQEQLASNMLYPKMRKQANDDPEPVIRSFDTRPEKCAWFQNYLHGVSMELYSATLSPAFADMTFAEAAVVCRQHLDLLLLAIVAQAPRGNGDILPIDNKFLAICPALSAGIKVGHRTVGFFICDSQSCADKVSRYCPTCGVKSLSSRRPCLHRRRKSSQAIKSSDSDHSPIKQLVESTIPFKETDQQQPEPTFELGPPQFPAIQVNQKPIEPTFDPTGLYYYGEERPFETSTLSYNLTNSPRRWKQTKLINHILVCLVADEGSPSLGLQSFIMPLRTSSYVESQLKPILLLGNEQLLRSEWPKIANFPDIYCLPGSPLRRSDLRQARIRFCSTCVIVGSRQQLRRDDPYMSDNEVILCTLNIRAMQFPPISQRLRIQCPGLPYRKYGSEIPIVTELMVDANIHYLEAEYESWSSSSMSCNIPTSLTSSFAKGIAFTTSVLDVLASTAYFDQNTMTLIRHLVTGGVTPTLEQWMGESGTLSGPIYADFTGQTEEDDDEDSDESNHTASRRSLKIDSLIPKSSLVGTQRRPHVEQLPLTDSRLGGEQSIGQLKYVDLFCRAIAQHGVICLGVYRTLNAEERAKFDRQLWENQSCKLKSRPSSLRLKRRLSTINASDEAMLRRRSSLRLTRDKSASNSYQQLESNEVVASQYSLKDRYVITNPPNSFLVQPSDLVFCLCPYADECEEE